MKFAMQPDKMTAKDLAAGDHVMVGDMLWRVVEGCPSMGNPIYMLKLAYHTHLEPKTFKFHPVGPEDRFEVLRVIE